MPQLIKEQLLLKDLAKHVKHSIRFGNDFVISP